MFMYFDFETYFRMLRLAWHEENRAGRRRLLFMLLVMVPVVAAADIDAGARQPDPPTIRCLTGAKFDCRNRTLLSFASDDAGRSTVARMRKEARKRGLDPGETRARSTSG
jgi:hypothetical protein